MKIFLVVMKDTLTEPVQIAATDSLTILNVDVS